MTEVGTLTLTCFGYNQLTYQADVLAIVPANVSVVPASVPVGVTTSVTVTVTDPDNGQGLTDVRIGIAGYGFNAAPVQTNAAGQVVFQVTPLYGETLVVTGREIGANYDLFHSDLPVTGAAALPNAAIAASVPSIGLVGSLTPHLEGQVNASAAVAGFTLFLDGGGLDVTQVAPGSALQVAVTPTQLSDVTAAMARNGYQVFSTTIPGRRGLRHARGHGRHAGAGAGIRRAGARFRRRRGPPGDAAVRPADQCAGAVHGGGRADGRLLRPLRRPSSASCRSRRPTSCSTAPTTTRWWCRTRPPACSPAP